MRKLYLITGPAGVGKSTISKIIAESKKKSALIEGDEIYHLVNGGYVNPWLEGNHLDVFWKNCIDIIRNFLDSEYDVIFNYIIDKDEINRFKDSFNNVEIRFVVLMTDDNTLIKRDQKRPLDCQMGERCIVLLNDFRNENYNPEYILDTSNLSIEDSVKEIENNERFIIK